MDVMEAIKTRRSVREYESRAIEKEVINELLEMATMAPSGRNFQPWGFVVIQDKKEVDEWSEKIKSFYAENIEKFPHMEPFKDRFTNPDYHIFHNAPSIIVTYGESSSPYSVKDGTMAATNIMYAGHSKGIGTCWIGLADFTLNSEEFKKRYNVSEGYELVSVLAIGYSKTQPVVPERKEPLVFNK